MKQFLGFLSLKVGTILCVSMYITVALSSIIVNCTISNMELLVPWIFCTICNLYTIATWLIVYYGSYKESLLLITITLNMWIVFTVVWFISAICSVNDHLESYVCLCKRCAESFWLFSNNWHDKCVKDVKKDHKGHHHFKEFSDVIQTIVARPVMKETVFNINHDFDYVALSIIIVFAHLILGIITLASYARELKCLKSCQLDLNTSIEKDVRSKNIKVLKTSHDICNKNT